MLTTASGDLISSNDSASASVAQNQATLSIGDFDHEAGTLAVEYDSPSGPIGGFQFNTTG